MEYKDTIYRSELSTMNRVARLLWGIVYVVFFRPSPWFLYRWRVVLLRLFGASVDRSCIVHSSARVYAPWNLKMQPYACLASQSYCFNVAPVYIGEASTVSEGCYICTASHEIHSPGRELIAKPVHIDANAWIFARAMIGPGVTIGAGAVVAMGAVVVKDVEPNAVVGGNPARFIKQRDSA